MTISRAFRPDGSRIVFYSDREGGGIYEVGTLGGTERRIAERGIHPRYSPDGAWISYIEIPASLDTRLTKMFLMPAQGGTPVPFQPEFGIVGLAAASAPVWSPDGKYLIFNGLRADDPKSLDWWVAPVSGGPAVRTNAHSSLSLPPVWQCPYGWVGSYIYFATGNTVEGVNLFRAHINNKNWKVSGPADRITSGAGMQIGASVLRDGRLVYSDLVWMTNILTLEAKPDQGLSIGKPVTLTEDAMAKFSPSLSRDGSKLAYSAFGGLQKPRTELRLWDLRKGEEKAFPVSTVQINLNPRISPDGAVIAYRLTSAGKAKTFIVSEKDPAGREVCDGCMILAFYGDPNFAVIRESAVRLARLDIATGERTLLLESRSGEIMDPALSPDDRWLAFVLGKPDGRVAMCLAPLDDTGAAAPEEDWIVLFEQDRYLGSPAWSPDGSHLYFVSERDGPCAVMAMRLEPGSKKPLGDSRIVYRPLQNRFNMNLPKGNGTVAVARDKLAIWMGEGTGNIYMAAPKKK